MQEKITPFFLRTLSSLHAGSGDDNGLVDLPIQRELVTGYPKVEASTLKGALRSRLEQLAGKNKDKQLRIHLAFGYDNDSKWEYGDKDKDKKIFSGSGNADSYADQFMGALSFTDARLLLFPMRSMRGVFALVTCPNILRRFREDLILAGYNGELKSILDAFEGTSLEETEFLATSQAPVKNGSGQVILEEYVFQAAPESGNIDQLAKQLKALADLDDSRLVILSDDVFSDFTQLFTERMTRNKIDDTSGTVKDGGLFTEEYLPPEAVLYSLLIADKTRQPEGRKALPDDFKKAEDVRQFITDRCWGKDKKKILQIGGNATVGKGIVELHFPKL